MKNIVVGFIVMVICAVSKAHTFASKEIPILPTQYFEVSLTGNDSNNYTERDGTFFFSRLYEFRAIFLEDGPEEPFIFFSFIPSVPQDWVIVDGNISIFLGPCEGQPFLYMGNPTAFELSKKGCLDIHFSGHPVGDISNKFVERHQITIVD